MGHNKLAVGARADGVKEHMSCGRIVRAVCGRSSGIGIDRVSRCGVCAAAAAVGNGERRRFGVYLLSVPFLTL